MQYILDSVVQELSHDPKKKFIYVETAFFWKWWMEQEDHMRHIVKKLVANGQLEFIGGAWSMNDEATTHYQSVIDQFTWGFRYDGSKEIYLRYIQEKSTRKKRLQPSRTLKFTVEKNKAVISNSLPKLPPG